MKKKKKLSQVAMEYMLLLTVLLIVLLAALAGDASPLRRGISDYVDGLGGSIANVIDAE